jgi:thiosulfate/3-mercaptopyruvate sulfurtransferase
MNYLIMNAQTKRLLGSLATLIILSGISPGFSQSGEQRKRNDLVEPAALAATLGDAKAAKPVIFNIGSVQQIKGAISIGPAGVQGNLDKFKQQLAKLPKDKEVIIYCGCCPFTRCPNVGPAMELLKKMKFTNAKLLYLPSNLNDDWISKGYPMQ